MDSQPERQTDVTGEMFTRGAVPGLDPASDVLKEAADTVRDRETHYGHPIDDFEAQAAAISAYLRRRFVARTNHKGQAEDIWDVTRSLVQRDDIPAIMVIVKTMRWAEERKRDNMVDVAGYAKAAERAIGRDP